VAGPYVTVLAAAARCWTQVLAGQVDAEEVVAAGRRMQAVGLGWEAAQLVGRAAPLAGDRRVTAGLHAAARALDTAVGSAVDPAADGDPPTADAPASVPAIPEQVVAPEAPTAPGAAAATPPADPDQSGFTERELEIGQHILAGLTYKQIGQRLYLSAKTVEHHVARMRQRLGVASRDELFGLLRAALDAEAKDRRASQRAPASEERSRSGSRPIDAETSG
jgi:DNA-binding CsgD family transcriptional regulator